MKIEEFTSSNCYFVKYGNQYLNIYGEKNQFEIYLGNKINNNKKYYNFETTNININLPETNKLLFNLIGTVNGNELYTISSSGSVPIYLKAKCDGSLTASYTNNSSDNYWLINNIEDGVYIESYKYPKKYVSVKSNRGGYLLERRGNLILSTKKKKWMLIPCQKTITTTKIITTLPPTTSTTTPPPITSTTIPSPTTSTTTPPPITSTIIPLTTTSTTTPSPITSTTKKPITSMPPSSMPPTSIPPTSMPPTSMPPTSMAPTSKLNTSKLPTSMPPISMPSITKLPTSMPPI